MSHASVRSSVHLPSFQGAGFPDSDVSLKRPRSESITFTLHSSYIFVMGCREFGRDWAPNKVPRQALSSESLLIGSKYSPSWAAMSILSQRSLNLLRVARVSLAVSPSNINASKRKNWTDQALESNSPPHGATMTRRVVFT